MGNTLSAKLPTSTPERNALGDAISSLAEVCRHLNREHNIIIHGSKIPVKDWKPVDRLSIANDTEKIRGKVQDGDTLHLDIVRTGNLNVSEIIQIIRDACEEISFTSQL